MPNLNQSLRDRVVRHELYLKRLANEEVRRTRELLLAAEADVQKQIERRMAWIAERGFDSSPFTLRRLEANLKEVRAVVRAAHRELGGQLRSSLLGVAKHEAGWAAEAVAGELAGVGVELGVGVAEGPLLSAIVNKQPFQGALLKDWAAKLGEDTFHAVRGAVRQGLLQGEAIGDIVRRLRGTKANDFKDGVLAIRRRNAEAVVRTAVSSVANSAREATWKANDDLVKGVQWVSTLDDRTTPQCQIRDGLEYTLDYEPRGHSVPWGDGPGALHWNCRSTSVPVLATWKELGIDAREVTGEQRAALDGMVPSTQNFGEWLGHMRDQGRLGLVEEVLGKKRAAAFMAGEIKFKDLFNAKGDFLTLDKLKLADPGRLATQAVLKGGPALEQLAASLAKPFPLSAWDPHSEEFTSALNERRYYHGTTRAGIDELKMGADEFNDYEGLSLTDDFKYASDYAGSAGEVHVLEIEATADASYMRVSRDFWDGVSLRKVHRPIYDEVRRRGGDIGDMVDLQKAMERLGYDGWFAVGDTGSVTELRLFRSAPYSTTKVVKMSEAAAKSAAKKVGKVGKAAARPLPKTMAEFEKMIADSAHDVDIMIQSPVRSMTDVEYWNKVVGVRPDDYLDAISGGRRIRGSLELWEDHGGRNVLIHGELTSIPAAGERPTVYGDISRRVIGDNAHHGLLRLSEAHNGSGIARDILRESFALYKKLGVKTVDLDANINVGGYAWAKYGFKPDVDEWMRFTRYATEKLDVLESSAPALKGSKRGTLRGAMTAAERRALMNLLQSKDPRTIWAIAEFETVSGVKVGKQLLLGSYWHGEINLLDREAMERFEAYLARGR